MKLINENILVEVMEVEDEVIIKPFDTNVYDTAVVVETYDSEVVDRGDLVCYRSGAGEKMNYNDRDVLIINTRDIAYITE